MNAYIRLACFFLIINLNKARTSALRNQSPLVAQSDQCATPLSFLCLPVVVQFQPHRLSIDATPDGEESPACPCVGELWVAAGDFPLAARTDCNRSVQAALGCRSHLRTAWVEQRVVLGRRSKTCFINGSTLGRQQQQQMNESTAACVHARQGETRSRLSRVLTNVRHSPFSLPFAVLFTFFSSVFFSTVSLQANRESRARQGYLRGSQTDRMARFVFSSLRTNRRSINKRQ